MYSSNDVIYDVIYTSVLSFLLNGFITLMHHVLSDKIPLCHKIFAHVDYGTYFLQIELFGRKFEPGEFDRMPPAEQQDKSDKMMSTIQKWREERRAKDLKQGIR